MADEFPDSDDVYDLIHEEEYEVLREFEEKSCKKRLQFTQNNETGEVNKLSQKKQVTRTLFSQSQASTPPIQNEILESAKNNNKRTIKNSFEDFGNLEGEENFHIAYYEPKVKKFRWDQEDDLINKIVAGRQKKDEKLQPMHVNAVQPGKQRTETISQKVPPWDFIAVTRPSDSQRFYLRLKNNKDCAVVKSQPTSGLLSAPFSELKAEAEEILARAAQKKIEKTKESEVIPAAFGNELWVDKYRPRKYMELLSEEIVNRTLLHWLKTWDKMVFQKDPIRRRVQKTVPKFAEKKFMNKNIEGLDDKGFPIHRIALLSGPPGLGKTTLAHLAAHHTGYNVVDINASSDRGAKEFRAALLSSTQMKAVMGKNPRPNCLVMDEVDGAPVASINILLKFIQGKLDEDSDLPGKKKKKEAKKESVGCRRPIICICNDPYAPSLRALRLMALVIPISGVSAGRIAGRLIEVLRSQGLDADPVALVNLAEQSGCDVRACLGALQYMGGIQYGQKLSIAPKDVRRGIFDSWKQILQVPRGRNGPLSTKERAQKVFEVARNGETDLLARGVFHNYPEVVFRDDGMENVAKSLEWFQFYDELNHTVTSQQAWNLLPYTNHAFVAWHFAFAGIQNPKLTYPSDANEVNQKLARTNEILDVTRKVSGIDKMALIFDIAPLLTDLLTPSLRSVSYHLYSAAEKANLARLVNVLLDLGLNLVQDKTPEGGYVYNLEPNLEEVGIFSDCKTRRSLTYAVKQIVVRELEIARLKKFNVSTVKYSAGDNPKAGTSKDSNIPKTPTVPNHLVRLQPIAKQVPQELQQHRDFFGRLVFKSLNQNAPGVKKSNVSPESKQALSRSDVWFKYKEGYSNAVKRKVRIRELV